MKHLFFLAVVFCFSGCTNISNKTLSIYNASEENIFLESIAGIHFFEPGSGPQDFGGKEYPPNHLGRITSYQTVYIDSPIIVVWRMNQKHHTTEINSVKKLPSKPMDYDGNIVLVFETNRIWSATFMEGDTAPPVQVLEKMYKEGGRR